MSDEIPSTDADPLCSVALLEKETEGKKLFVIQVYEASEENLQGYGTLVSNFENTKVEKRPWPMQGSRQAVKGTDIIPGEESSEITYRYNEGKCTASKDIGKCTTIGQIVPSINQSQAHGILVQEMTYHPDCGEVFFPKAGDAFIALLAKPGDDFDPLKVKAFYFDGSVGLQASPNVWHQGMFPLNGDTVFQGKQGILHCCVTINTMQEFDGYLYFELSRPK